MTWQQLVLTTTDAQAENLSDWLLEHGAVSVSFQDAADFPIYEPPLETTPLWPTVQVLGLFTAEIALAPLIKFLLEDNHFYLLSPPEQHTLPEQDWVRNSIADFKPIHIGHNLWICPSWCEVDAPNAVIIHLDPGLAFGTGTHPTTALMLEFLAAHPPVNKSVIDYGCGSGILALACAKLGATKVVAVDIDPQALQATQNNAEHNQVHIETITPSALRDDKVDLIIANILLTPLLELKPVFLALLKPQGQIILSGLLKSQADVLIAHYQPEMQLHISGEKEDWVRLSKS